ISRALLKPSTRPVGLPCASCVWNCSREALAAGAGASAAGGGAAASLSTSLEVSLDLPFFLVPSPRGQKYLRNPNDLSKISIGFRECACEIEMFAIRC
uniref:Uncharacterized protein n=1 Tax=Meleagris gallopavo TaxID=9103 RepID=A0A803YBV2_MELGA